MEQGYCLFGDIEGNTAIVKEVVHTKYPIPWTHSARRIDFSCIPEIVVRIPELSVSDYSFIGAVHTHPNGSTEMSNPDKEFFKATPIFQRIHGIAIKNQVSFYTVKNTEYPVKTLDFVSKSANEGDASST